MKGYKAVIGLEVHAQLLTQSKMFCSASAVYGGEPNSHTTPISLGLPGALPRVNQQAIDFAIRMGLATHCTIRDFNLFARKNYFYADLPKGYQISQHNTPICYDGEVEIPLKSGAHKKIRIMRIHIEEDSGKSLHDQDVYNSLVDLNRAGIPLIEIVTEADIESPEEASAYVTEIRKLVRYLGICDGNMEEGSLRCDANISVMKTDAKEWGTKVEVKNMNSISNIGRAVQFEIDRQIEANEKGEKIIQQTRTWDAMKNQTVIMREKESSDDYRYFAEPDLQPLIVTPEMLNKVKATLPELPKQLYARYTRELGISHDDAFTILELKEFSDWFNTLLATQIEIKDAVKWALGPVRLLMNYTATKIENFKVDQELVFIFSQQVAQGNLSFSIAKQEFQSIGENVNNLGSKSIYITIEGKKLKLLPVSWGTKKGEGGESIDFASDENRSGPIREYYFQDFVSGKFATDINNFEAQLEIGKFKLHYDFYKIVFYNEIVWAIKQFKMNLKDAALDFLDSILAEYIGKLKNSVLSYCENKNLILETNSNEIALATQELIAKFPEKAEAYRSGKTGLLGFFVGQVMQATKGKADPKEVNRVVAEILGGN